MSWHFVIRFLTEGLKRKVYKVLRTKHLLYIFQINDLLSPLEIF